MTNKKKAFLISYYKLLWDSEHEDAFIASPYILHALEKNNEVEKFNKVEVADYLRKSSKDLILYSDFVDQKYHKYVMILTDRLNEIHKLDYGLKFWEKVWLTVYRM